MHVFQHQLKQIDMHVMFPLDMEVVFSIFPKVLIIFSFLLIANENKLKFFWHSIIWQSDITRLTVFHILDK